MAASGRRAGDVHLDCGELVVHFGVHRIRPAAVGFSLIF
jgi:hypothetical protein